MDVSFFHAAYLYYARRSLPRNGLAGTHDCGMVDGMSEFHEHVVAQAIDHLVAHHAAAPDLEALAIRFGYEPTQFQKIFRQKVGISPKRLVQYMNYRTARQFLLEGHATLEAAYQAGLSGGGRLHDLFVVCEGATPGAVQRRGEGMVITYGWHPTPLGEILLGVSARGVCWLGFRVEDSRDVAYGRMRAHWPRVDFVDNATAIADAASHILRIWEGKGDEGRKLRLDLHGTNFQIQVWQALLKIPTGGMVSYQDIAGALGVPKACRAVGSAVGANPVSLLIPCHRVIQKSGIVENYGWGTLRKKALLAIEGRRFSEDGEA